jgi:hypothetical protein
MARKLSIHEAPMFRDALNEQLMSLMFTLRMIDSGEFRAGIVASIRDLSATIKGVDESIERFHATKKNDAREMTSLILSNINRPEEEWVLSTETS